MDQEGTRTQDQWAPMGVHFFTRPSSITCSRLEIELGGLLEHEWTEQQFEEVHQAIAQT